MLLQILLLISLLSRPHETIVVTGTYEPLSLDEIDRAVTVLPVREHREVFNSLADVLRQDSSVDLEARAPDGVQNDLSIRGSSYAQTLVLLNGMRLDDAQSGHHNMDIPVPLDAIARVEVLEGSGSTMYGSDAIGGAVNVITAPPQYTELVLRTAAGNFGINQQQGALSGVLGPVAEQVSFARDFSTGFLPDRDYRNLQLASTTQLASKWGTADLTMAYMDHPFGADQFYGDYPSWEDTKTWFLGLQQAIGKKTTASFAYRRHSDLFVLIRDDPSVYTNHHQDESYQAAVRRNENPATNIELHYGVEALHESIASNNLGNHSRSRAAAYAALDFRALRRFSLSLAAREEVYRNFSGEFSPTIAGGYWLSPHLKLRASVSRAFRVPSYTELYYEDPANIGNPNLRPERAWNYEGGIDWNPAARWHADLTVFERRERDDIDYYRTSPNALWQAVNIDALNFTGVTGGIRFAISNGQSLDLHYSWLRGAEDSIPIGETKYAFYYPRHSAVASWQGTLAQHVVLRTHLGVLDRLSEGAYALLDIDAAYTRGIVHPFLRLSNMTNTSYEEVQGVVMPGRSIIGGVELVLRGK
ncbi:MAG TPA: TonB-dependent receptor [Bryobacteraceae bacterium]|nr:TonB-dependent receptor [Bryobacteraceae bacterium]